MQSTNNIFLIRPSNFVFNSETASSNAFQNNIQNQDNATIKQNVFKEFELFAETLKFKGVNVFIFDDTPSPHKPDAIFPNNWVTFHPDGTVILYPMFALNRRHERRTDIIDSLRNRFKITNVVDLSPYEKENRFLEGTGSIVFDHVNKIAYACLSPRTDKELFIQLSKQIGYKPIYFHSLDKNGKEIYHTNVMMCIGDAFAVICLESIANSKEKEQIINSFAETGHQLVNITFEQMNNFSGNMLALQTNQHKNILILSKSSFDSLTETQKKTLSSYCELIPMPIKTIETIGGGSARCMIAEIFLQPIINN